MLIKIGIARDADNNFDYNYIKNYSLDISDANFPMKLHFIKIGDDLMNNRVGKFQKE